MRLKETVGHASPGRVDVLEILLETSSRKVTRRIKAWMQGPHWIPSSQQLEAMRTSTRGRVRNLLTGLSQEANSLHGEISAR